MCMFSRVLLLSILAVTALADEGPGLGEPVDAERIAALDYTVMPDGDGLPAGSGTAAAGRAVFEQHCIACHGPKGEGSLNDRLAGGLGTLQSDAPVKTVGSYWPYATTVFDYVRRAMPLQSPGILSDDELYAVTAYLLFLNGIVEQDDALTQTSLPAVQMPNRDGFVWDYSP